MKKYWIKLSDDESQTYDVNYERIGEIYWYAGSQGITLPPVKIEMVDLRKDNRNFICLLPIDLNDDHALLIKLRFGFHDVKKMVEEMEQIESDRASSPDRCVVIRFTKIRDQLGLPS